MKKSSHLAIGLLAFSILSVFGQPTGTPAASPDNFQTRVRQIVEKSTGTPGLKKFSLEFPGGTPKELIAAIEKSTGKPLNAIVPDEFAATRLPPIKVSNVSVPQLFETLMEGSYKYNDGNVVSSYGFRTVDKQTPDDDSIWTFFAYKAQPTSTGLSKFDLDFPGGTPKQLMAAIEKAMGKPLNVVVPDEFAATKLPPLRMNGVDVSKLFKALEISSIKTVAYITGTTTDASGATRSTYQQSQTAYGFRTEGPISDGSVWHFHVDGSNLPLLYQSKISRYYSLTPYLDQGLTVDDITTAIQTGWKMQGDASTPQISFHKETRLLIAVGEPNKLDTIDAVLKALDKPQAKNPASKPAELQKITQP